MFTRSLWILVLSMCSVSFALGAEPSVIEGAKKEAALVFYTTMDIQNSKPVLDAFTKKYPFITHVYGEPAGQTVNDSWGGSQLLFHRALASTGYIVISIDNRGTPAPRGTEWRKIVYGTVGDLSSKDQAAAVRALPGVDPARVVEKASVPSTTPSALITAAMCMSLCVSTPPTTSIL